MKVWAVVFLFAFFSSTASSQYLTLEWETRCEIGTGQYVRYIGRINANPEGYLLRQPSLTQPWELVNCKTQATEGSLPNVAGFPANWLNNVAPPIVPDLDANGTSDLMLMVYGASGNVLRITDLKTDNILGEVAGTYVACDDIDADGIYEIIVVNAGTILVYGTGQSVLSTVHEPGSTPVKMSLRQNYPNPFNPSTSISFTVPTASHVVVRIHDIQGRVVRNLVDEGMDAGTYERQWDGRDSNGIQIASGSYFYQMTAGDFVDSKKMLLLK